ncbi:metallophosphoesterase family protein [Streptomyces sp. NPDC056269]|uniref:metallophosphoesterase family protein n=1 Tax=Streptomyces sp. NPDC056269 TaxID=3345768 RepID=UPI0035D8194F
MDRRSLLTVATGAVGAVAAAQIPAGAARPAQPGPAAQHGPTHAGPGRPVATFNVISDIQGDLRDLGVALEDMNRTNRTSAGLAVAGDITPRGYDAEYAAVASEVARHTHPRTVAWAIGNHEFYVPKWRDPSTLAQDTWPNGTTEDSLFRSFYAFAGRNTVYAEHSFGGIPVLSLGTERYMHYHDPKLWDEVWLSEAQLTWLEERLAHWARRRKPVMVITHHPLPNTVSGSHNRLYSRDYLQADRLLGILGRHKDVFLFCGHTHWDLALSDWYVRRVVPGTANLDGFSVINTGAVQTGYTDDGKGGEVTVPGTFNQGLQVEVFRDRVVVKARDFAAGAWLKQITVPLSTRI